MGLESHSVYSGKLVVTSNPVLSDDTALPMASPARTSSTTLSYLLADKSLGAKKRESLTMGHKKLLEIFTAVSLC